MKKLLFLSVFLVLLVLVSQAQQKFPNTNTSGTTKDSVTNVDTVYSSYQTPNNISLVTLELDIVSKSGTIAGKAYVQGSVSGVYWTNFDSTTLTPVVQPNGTTASVTYFKYTSAPYVFYRIQTLATGTQVSYVRAYGLFRKSYYNPL